MFSKRSFKAISLMVVLAVIMSIFCAAIPVSAADKGAWAPNTAYAAGDTATYNGSTYTCLQPHTSLVGWEPSNVPALWKLGGGSTPTQVATPVFSPAGGTYTTAQSVNISCGTSGATIRYTTNGSEPTSSSTMYSSAITVSTTTTIKAKAFKSGMTDSAVASVTYTVAGTPTQVATPTFSPADGTYTSSVSITISCATTGSTIRYTTNGSDPTSASTAYTNAITISSTTTIKAKAFKSGMTDSAVASATYTIGGSDGGSSFGNRVFAPYVDVMQWPIFSINDCYTKTGQKYFTLAFITANGTEPAWGGVTAMSDNYYMDEINNIRSKGGNVIVSFGGANGTELALNVTDATALQAKYQAVIDRYKLTWIDFDIEGTAVTDKASIDRRNKAVAGLQAKNPGLTVAYCLPVLPSGLTSDGVYVLTNAKANGVRIDVVNVMAMDFGDWAAPSPDGKMGDYAIQSAQSTYNQCTSNGISTKIGVTPMIGHNDTASEIFYLSDAQKLANWAQSTSWMRLLAMWSANRDNGDGGALYKSSGIPQQLYDFTNIFKAYK